MLLGMTIPDVIARERGWQTLRIDQLIGYVCLVVVSTVSVNGICKGAYGYTPTLVPDPCLPVSSARASTHVLHHAHQPGGLYL